MASAAGSAVLEAAVRQLGWLYQTSAPGTSSAATHDRCLLAELLAYLSEQDFVSSSSQALRRLTHALRRCSRSGFTLRSRVPHVDSRVQTEWLGGRMLFVHARWLRDSSRWTSLVSSRLGRYGHQLHTWPRDLERALKTIRNSDQLVLTVPNTTLAPLLEPLLARSAAPYLRVRLPPTPVESFSRWLASQLESFECESLTAQSEVSLSPAFFCEHPKMQSHPLQDRVAVCWGHRVRALSVRPSGTIAQLLAHRLNDPAFPIATVTMRLPPREQRQNSKCPRAADHQRNAWLDRGVVGWYIPPPLVTEQSPARRRCSQHTAYDEHPRAQITAPYSLFGRGRPQSASGRPRYLVHCVRGWQGLLPQESASEFIARAWLDGRLPDDSPQATLFQILASGCLRGRAALQREPVACVSFSAVPLDQLIQRRTFQSHLGRWDWEPFGIMIRREALERVGARPVIYGSSSDFDALAPDQRQYFQLARRRTASNEESHWEHEREWRVLKEVRLRELPQSAVTVFVAYEFQAQALARDCRWPVIWLLENRTPTSPSRSTSPRRKAIQTSKN